MRHSFKTSAVALFACLCGMGGLTAQENRLNTNSIMEEKLNLTQEWDKTFPQSDEVNHSKITFHNRYGITLAADLYMPKNATGKLPLLPSADHSGLSRNRHRDCMRRNWQSAVSSPSPSTPRLPARAVASPAM